MSKVEETALEIPAKGKVNILVVDDLPDRLLVFESILETLDERLMFARSGEEALKLVLQHDFAVILLDVNMPRMDGFETAALIRSRKRSAHVPIIFITAYADELQTERGYSIGAVDYILTPIVPDILRTKVSVFAELFRMQQQIREQADERISFAEEQARRAAAEEANRKLAFLANASRKLSDLLDVSTCLSTFCELAVPFLGDVSAICLYEESERRWKRVACSSLNGKRAVSTATGLPPLLARETEQVFVTGLPKVLEDVTLECGEPEQDGAYPLSFCVLYPLRTGSRMLGVLLVGKGDGIEEFSQEELSAAEDFAGRGAVALENALLYDSIREADRRKNEFLAMLAHELRNPLAPIRNAVKILEHFKIEHPQIIWAGDVIDRQLTHLVHLVDDLLDVSRITRGQINLKLSEVDAVKALASALETCKPFLEIQEHEVRLQAPEEPLWVTADSARLTQILTNLLHNAAKDTPPKGTISLSLEHQDSKAVFRVKDTGVGIPDAMLPRIFDLFTQVDRSIDRSQGGLGIGLTLAKRLVEMHGGVIQAFSAGQNRGSEFVVQLPALDKPTVREAPGKSRPQAKITGKRVLVVDDNIDAADSLGLLLRLDGHEVSLAYDGLSALELAQRCEPEVVLLDIGLPGMDGYAVARALREDPRLSSVRLVAVSGYGQLKDCTRTKDAGFDHHLIKPVDLESLSEILSRV